MEHIGIYEARNDFSKLIQRVQEGEEFIITNRGKEMAVLISPAKQHRKNLQATRNAMRKVFKEQSPGTLTEMMEWAKEGQR